MGQPQKKIYSEIKKLIKKTKIPFSFTPIIAAVSGLFGYYEGVDSSGVTKGQIKCKTCFTPAESCLPFILNAIYSAKHTIDMQAYTMTSRKIASALIDAKNRGVKVRILFDKSQQNNPHGQFNTLKKHHFNIRFDTKPAIAHNKVMVLDGQNTITGSYNWTEAAEKRNAENLLLIENKDIAQRYHDNFEKRWVISKDSISNRQKNYFI